MTAGLATRQAAYHILHQILIKKTPFDQILSDPKTFDGLEGRDRSFARMMISTILRHRGQMNILISKARDGKEIDQETIFLFLYIGIVQLLFMKVPSHAAIDTTVSLAEAEHHTRQKGLINALLRRIDREGQEWLKTIDAIRADIPDWLLTSWVEDYGLEEAAQIAEASLREASTDITVKETSEINQWSEKLEADILPTGSLRLREAKDIPTLEGFREGKWWVQDAASALPVNLLPDDLTGKTVIDLCAAPGGKTMQLAARGAQVIAVDRSQNRLKRLKENMDRVGLGDQVDIVTADGAMWQPSELADIVLLDAPCSATGTIRRHPDLMHLKSGQDVDKLAALQEKLLNNAAQMIKGDGILIYCTCSLQKKEGEIQVQNFLNDNSDFQTVPYLKEDMSGLEDAITDDGLIRIRPDMLKNEGGLDGFFIARLQKT